jgi:hypothetical protein
MKTVTLTIRLDKDLADLLTKASKQSGRKRSEIARGSTATTPTSAIRGIEEEDHAFC